VESSSEGAGDRVSGDYASRFSVDIVRGKSMSVERKGEGEGGVEGEGEQQQQQQPTEEEHYQSFLSALRLSVHPSREYRVAVNFLRGALFGCANYLPSTVLLSLLGGHFSPVINVWDEVGSHGAQGEAMCSVFDVNAAYGLCILPARRLFASVRTHDIMTGQSRGMLVTRLRPAAVAE